MKFRMILKRHRRYSFIIVKLSIFGIVSNTANTRYIFIDEDLKFIWMRAL